nr:CAP domain-containing protein [uncultured Undibacterium sp.]
MQKNRGRVVAIVFLIGMMSACSSDLTVVKDPVPKQLSSAVLKIDNGVFAEIFPTDGLSNDTCGLPDFTEPVIQKINEIRAQPRYCGKEYFEAAAPLAWQNSIRNAAYQHSVQMAQANVVSHTSFDSRELNQRILATGYPYMKAGENIAAGQRTLDVVMQGWLDSPSHCNKMMDPDYTEVVVVCVAKKNSFYKTYWTMNLVKPFSSESAPKKKLPKAPSVIEKFYSNRNVQP